MNKLFLVVPILIVVAGCQQAPMSADPSVITARDAAWQKAVNTGDVDAIVDIYADDARRMPPNAPAITGRAAIRESFSVMVEEGLQVEIVGVDVKVSGDTAYDVGTYRLNSGDQVVDTGKFTSIWKQGADGQWRVTNDIWNSDLPVPTVSDAGTHVMVTHEVADGDHWLAAWLGEDGRRKMFAKSGLTNVHTFQSVENPNLTGLEFTGSLEAFQAMLDDPKVQAAAADDGVMLDSMKIFKEAE